MQCSGRSKNIDATLIFPVLKQDRTWKDQTKFEDIFYVIIRHDIGY
ncbi:hypothetical protein LINPERHAP2_LOCUS5976 [Linum perenne]